MSNRLIVADAGWAKSVPEWLLKAVEAERLVYGLATIGKKVPEHVGDAEVCVYLFTHSLKQLMPPEFTKIYIYLASKLMKKRGIQLLDDFEEALRNGLTDYEKEELNRIRSNIAHKRGKVEIPLVNLLKEVFKDGQRTNTSKSEM